MGSSLRHPILRLGAQTGSPPAACHNLLAEPLTHDTSALELQGIVKIFGRLRANDGVYLTVRWVRSTLFSAKTARAARRS